MYWHSTGLQLLTCVRACVRVCVCVFTYVSPQDNATGGGCIDLWRDERPAHGENGTYNDYIFTAEAERIISTHPKTKPLFIYQAFQNVHGPVRHRPHADAHTLTCTRTRVFYASIVLIRIENRSQIGQNSL